MKFYLLFTDGMALQGSHPYVRGFIKAQSLSLSLSPPLPQAKSLALVQL